MKIKVLHLITKLEFGGAQQNTLYTAEHLNSTDFEVVLASGPGGYLDAKAQALASRINVQWIRFLKREVRPWWDLLAFLELWILLRRLKPHVLHTHSSKAGILGRWAAFLAGVPAIVHTFHGFGFNEWQPALSRWIYVACERLTAKITAQFIYVSYENMKVAEKYRLYARTPPLLIRSGVLPPQGRYPKETSCKRSKRKELGIPEDSKVIVTIANLKPQKNPAHFVELARRFESRRPQAAFLFVGGTEDNRKLGGPLPSNFRYLGWREDAQEIVAAGDLFVLTSLWEGLPRSAVEALWRGIPVCAYATDGLKEIVQDGVNGYLIEAGNLDAMAARVEGLLSPSGPLENLAKKAAQSIGAEFDINQMVLQQENLYKWLIK